MKEKKKLKENTLIARAGVDEDAMHGSVMPPLYMSTNFSFEGFEKKRPYDYSRSGNPTRDVLAEALAGLEKGAGAVVTATGMGALHLVFQLLKPGDVMIAPHDCYGGTHRLLTAAHKKGSFVVKFVNQTDDEALEAAFTEDVRMILVETPSNPLLRITDFEKVKTLAKKGDTLVVADNTFLSPILQTPLELGADIVLHSTTKYLNGHGDVVGGAVIAKTKELHEELSWWGNCIGITGSPFDSYMTLRGLRTLDVRVRRQQETAGQIAEFLNDYDAVRIVYYPGLESHKGHDIAGRQQKGFGAMLSFELVGGQDDVRAFIEKLELFSLAESLGGVESLVAHPATMTHAAMDAEARKTAGMSDGLLRLSIGLEDSDDLIADLARALS